MEIYVVRHTAVSVAKSVCYGQSEVPLADTFEAEWLALKTQLPAQPDLVFSSPSQRCVALANRFGQPVKTDKALLEMNFGDWELQPWDSINTAQLNPWMQDFVNVPAPNGENMLALYKRVAVFFESLRNQNYEQVVIVTHAGALRCIWAYLLEIPLQNCFKISIGFGEIFHVNLAQNPAADSIKRKQ